MGLSSSQVNILAWTERKTTIGYQLQNLSRQKISLSREMQNVTRKYQNALNTKAMKWSNNAGATYVDLSYANLMRPGAANQNKPYLITDSNGRVVLDSKYQKYAEMFSPDGKAGAKWQGATRAQILSELTGIPLDKINARVASSEAISAAADKVNELQAKGDKIKEPINNDTAAKFFERAGTVNVNQNSYNIARMYNNANTWTELGTSAVARQSMTNILNGIANNMKNWLSDEDYASFLDACKTTQTECNKYFTGTDSATKQALEDGVAGIKKKGDTYSVNMKIILDSLLGRYKTASEGNACGKNSQGSDVYYTRDRESTAWNNWKTEHAVWKAEYDAAYAAYEASINADNQVLTAEEESNFNFYDQLFTTIAEKGWVANGQVDDNQYLNNMLQNNLYFITTLEECIGENGLTYHEYNQTLAGSCDNIFMVNDTSLQNDALIEYEYEKSIINEKETRIDTRMTNLQTEQSAIIKMIESATNVKDENVERTFGIFA